MRPLRLQAYGTGSLDQDASEMLLLAQHLTAAHGATALAFMGHSTGCQDVVRFMATHGSAPPGCARLAANILQAPVSERARECMRSSLLLAAATTAAGGAGAARALIHSLNDTVWKMPRQ